MGELIALCLAPIVVFAQFWPQWALDAQHTGRVGVVQTTTDAGLRRTPAK